LSGLICVLEAGGESGEAALPYNGLVQCWPEIIRLAREGGAAAERKTLFGTE